MRFLPNGGNFMAASVPAACPITRWPQMQGAPPGWRRMNFAPAMRGHD